MLKKIARVGSRMIVPSTKGIFQKFHPIPSRPFVTKTESDFSSQLSIAKPYIIDKPEFDKKTIIDSMPFHDEKDFFALGESIFRENKKDLIPAYMNQISRRFPYGAKEEKVYDNLHFRSFMDGLIFISSESSLALIRGNPIMVQGALVAAVRHNRLEMIKQLFDYGAKLNTLKKSDIIPFSSIRYCQYGPDAETLKFLLSKGLHPKMLLDAYYDIAKCDKIPFDVERENFIKMFSDESVLSALLPYLNYFIKEDLDIIARFIEIISRCHRSLSISDGRITDFFNALKQLKYSAQNVSQNHESLMYAAANENTFVVKHLIACGVDPTLPQYTSKFFYGHRGFYGLTGDQIDQKRREILQRTIQSARFQIISATHKKIISGKIKM